MQFCESFFTCARLGQWGSAAVGQWERKGYEDETVGRWQAGSMGGWEEESMRGWEDERTGSRREEEGWREEADKAVYHDSLERVCPRQTPSRSPSPGRRYVIIGHRVGRATGIYEIWESRGEKIVRGFLIPFLRPFLGPFLRPFYGTLPVPVAYNPRGSLC